MTTPRDPLDAQGAPQPRSSWSTPPDPAGGGWPAQPQPGSTWSGDSATTGWATPVSPDPGTGWTATPTTGSWPAQQPSGADPGTGWTATPATASWPASPQHPIPPEPAWQATGSSSWQSPTAPPPGAPVAAGGAPPRKGRDGRQQPPILAPIVAFLGLAIAAGGTGLAAQSFGLFGGAAAGPTATPDLTAPPAETLDPFATDDPFVTETAGPPATPTPAPTAFVTPPPDQQASVTGTLLYTRDGDVWAVSGTGSSRVTDSGTDYMPVWSPDGQTIYFIQKTLQRGKQAPWGKGTARADTVTHTATDVMSMDADGSDRTRLYQSMFKTGAGQWSTVAVQPDVAPDGKTLVLVSDLGYVPVADFDYGPVELATMTTRGKGLESLGIDSGQGAYKDLGHNDPDYSPDGKRIAFTYNNRAGGQGAGIPRIGIIKTPFRNKTPDLSPRNRGYANPDWSPDGRYLAAERVTTDRRDIVILDPDTWEEVARLTTDGRSFAPVWSPNGDQIAYLHADGTKIDVRVMSLEQGATGPTLRLDQAVTVDGGVDPDSAPAWFIPEDQRIVQPTPEPGGTPEPPAASGEATTTP